MTLRNADVADLIDRLGDLYELDGAIVHRVLAYRRAAARLRSTPKSVDRLAAEGRLTDLPDIGKTLADKIVELRDTGRIAAYERLSATYPPGLSEIMHLPGVGAKTTRRLFDELGVVDLESLRAACESGRVRGVRGLGARAEEKILAAIAAGGGPRKGAILLDRALERAAALLEVVRAHPGCVAASEAGSLRRRRETVGDIDLIAAAEEPRPLLEAFAAAPLVAEVVAVGDSKASIVTHDRIQVDLRVVPPGDWGSLLQHFTGSKDHNVAIREEAQARGLKVSEWGVEEVETGVVHRFAEEDDLYRFLGYAPIPPELREDGGELEAARAGTLPALVRLEDIRGDLHAHTTASDGKDTVAAMAAAAMARGYGFLAITDHSRAVGMGIGLDAGEAEAHAAAIRRRAASLAGDGFALLAGIEVDILADGALDLPDDVLAGLDWVVASVHGARGQGRDELTARLVAAASHPHVDVIGHPTGRLLGERDPYDVDMEAVVRACAEHGTFLEVNASPRRLDLKPEHVRLAIGAGVPIVVSTDAHRTATLDVMRLGVATARRGWATAGDVVNARPWSSIARMRKPGRPAGPGR